MKGPAGFELMTDRFLVSAKTHCDTLLGNNTQTNISFKIIGLLDFNVYFYGKHVKIPYEMKISMCMQMRIQDFFFPRDNCVCQGVRVLFFVIFIT